MKKNKKEIVKIQNETLKMLIIIAAITTVITAILSIFVNIHSDEKRLDQNIQNISQAIAQSDIVKLELSDNDDIKLTFEQEALDKIAQQTIKNKTGARGLRSVIESTLQDLMFEMPSESDVAEIIITADTVDGGEPKIINKQ